ncbi:MAG TPA: M13 family metallopeptidase N-terminal domain-containing protein, partial [Bacillota bacterium]|nr:M13 family metallopeptidase N-terminal domain-containing protein [Bacillota bacterium]
MKYLNWLMNCVMASATVLAATQLPAAETAPKVPRFSLEYMDPAVEPGTDFYRYADGNWMKNNPVPADKSRWGAFMELQERNWFLIHQILDSAAAAKPAPNSPLQKVADFFRSAMDTNRLEQLGFKPLQPDLKRIEQVKSIEDLLRLLADFHERGIGGCFGESVSPDAKNSEVYAYHLGQGGLSLPDRDYYLSERFAKQREAYVAHVSNMFTLLGEEPAAAKAHAATVLELETALAKASKSRVELRDPIANYHKFAVAEVAREYPDVPIKTYLAAEGLDHVSEVIIGQPEFFQSLYALIKERPLQDWKTYLRWHLLNASAPYLHA